MPSGSVNAEELKIIELWIDSNKQVFAGEIPANRKEAEQRFICMWLSGGPCVLSGRSCARRRRLAVDRVRLHEMGMERPQPRSLEDDQRCANCKPGSARNQLLIADGSPKTDQAIPAEAGGDYTE